MINDTYKNHQVFTTLMRYANFYKELSSSVFSFITPGTKAICNIDTYVYSSMQGTLESINDILIKGRIGDSYSLLRKYYDFAIVNIYSNLYIQNHQKRIGEGLASGEKIHPDNYLATKINNWLKGKEKISSRRVIWGYLKGSQGLSEINKILYQDKRYEEISTRCNDHIHYNYFKNVLINDNEIYLKQRMTTLDTFLDDLENIFILHFSYLFYLNGHYMASSDYMDYLECGMNPEEGCQYNVASYIQEVFDTVIKKKRMDLASFVLEKTSMNLK